MRAHQGITEIKERYNYNFNQIKQSDIESIATEILRDLKVDNQIVPPIVDITNRLGFSVYYFPFQKEKFDGDAMIGVGIEFNLNENSNFFFIEKDASEQDKRFMIAYLLAHYIFMIDERSTDYYKYVYKNETLKSDRVLRLSLSLLMPEDMFLAEYEFLKVSYQVQNRILTMDDIYKKLSKIFRVPENFIKARFVTLRGKVKEV